jgi:hypothetical protein
MSDGERYRYYANGILLIHVFWTFLIIAGAVVMFISPFYAIGEIVIVTFTLLISLPFKAVCPLTLLEGRLRRKFDASYSNHNSYLVTYINKIFKTHFAVRTIGIIVAIFYVFIYASAAYLILHGRG